MEAARLLNQELLEQYILAGSPHTSREQLRVLAEHFCDKIRIRVAENPKTPADVLRNFAHDANHDVRVAVAGNESCEQSVIYALARDSDVVVRHGLAQNIATPRVILEELADDDNGWVRGEALKTLHILDSKSGDEVGRRRQLKRERDRVALADFDERAHANEEVAG